MVRRQDQAEELKALGCEGRGKAPAAACHVGLIKPTLASLFCFKPAPAAFPCSADEVVVSTAGEGLAERVKEITGGEGAYAAIECVGGDLFAAVSELRPSPLPLLTLPIQMSSHQPGCPLTLPSPFATPSPCAYLRSCRRCATAAPRSSTAP